VNGFTLITTIRIIDQFDVEKGGYYETEEELKELKEYAKKPKSEVARDIINELVSII